MRIAILGAGAMGCLFAARLAQTTPVILLSQWDAAIGQIGTKGIRLLDEAGEHIVPLPIADDPRQARPADLALILVKSYQTERAAAWASIALAEGGSALTLQNGLGNRETIANHVGWARTIQGVTSEGATLLGPGEVRHGGAGETILSFGNSEEREEVEGIANVLRRAGFKTRLVSDIEGLIWGKLIASASINPLSALLNIPNGELLVNVWARAALHRAVGEAAHVAEAAGIRLPYADPVTHTENICRATAPNISSMLQDLQHGRPTEVDAINGALLRVAARYDLTAPTHTLLWQLVKAREGRTTNKP